MLVCQAQQKPIRREIELDFIRGLAILLVLDFHAPRPILLAPFTWLGWARFGWVGVDVFFVLSGFLVGGLLVKEWKLSGRIDSRRFLIRRGFKIWPQYYVFIFVILITGHRGLQSVWGNLLNIQNYVGGVAHTWTLAVEEHAYLLLVAVSAFAAHRQAKMRTFFFTTAAVALSVIVWRFVLAARGGNVFTRTDTRIDGILYGLMLAMLYHYAPAQFRRLQSWIWVWVGVVLVALAYLRINSTAWWDSSLSYVCADAMGVALLLLLYRRREGRQRPAIYRFIAWIGLYSYGIYLWHVSVIAPVMSVSHRFPGWLGTLWITCAPALLGISLGVVATKAVEFPALALRDRLFPRRVDSAVGIPAEVEKEMNMETVPSSISVD
jgi:peptidoglycan/LPS O-acetylase OafA/YrhL